MVQRYFLAVFARCIPFGIYLFPGPGNAQGSNDARLDFWVPSHPPRVHYMVDCIIDTTNRTLTGMEVLDFKNVSMKPISRLAVDWTVTGNQSIEISSDGKPLKMLLDFGGVNLSPPLLFELPNVISTGNEARLNIKFTFKVSGLGDPNPKTITKWLPRLWWGFKTHDDFEVKLKSPDGYAVATSGRYDSTTGYYHAEGVPSFGLFFGKGMKASEAHIGDVVLRCLYRARGEACARLILETAQDVISFYRQHFGFYPFKTLTIVPGYFDKPFGGYPAATAIVAIHGQEQMNEAPEIHWRWITAHEIGHQYWGEYVLEKDNPDWLWIGLGIYTDREYIRFRGLSLEKHRGMMSRYTRAVLNHLSTTVGVPPEQVDDLYDAGVDYNNVVTHGKGFSIISALANLLGPETFDRISQRCLRDFGGKRLGEHEFRAVCEAETGQDLGWFFDQWVHSNKFLSYQVTSQKTLQDNGQFLSTVRVERLGGIKMPVPVVAHFQDGSTQRKYTDRLLDTNDLLFTSSTALKQVQLDPDSELAMVVPPPAMTGEELTKAVRRLPWSGAPREALLLFGKVQAFKTTNEDFWAKLALNLYDGQNYTESMDCFRRTLEVAKDSSNWSFAARVWQGHILDLLGHRQEAVVCYKEALRKHVGQEMHHGQYNMVINRRWVEERIEKPFRRE